MSVVWRGQENLWEFHLFLTLRSLKIHAPAQLSRESLDPLATGY